MKRNAVMKRVLVCIMFLMALVLVPSNVTLATEATTATTETTEATTETVTTETTEQEKPKYTGWKTIKGKKYYYVNDKKVKGWKKIGKYYYYFNKKGVMEKNKMISKNKYVNSKGRLINKSKIYANGKNGLKKLKKKLQKQVNRYGGTYSIYVKNLDTNEYMVINNKSMKPASVIKLFNMGAVYDQINKKKLKEDSSVKSNLRSMITVSSNDGYNVLLNKMGKGNTVAGINYVNKFCKKYGYKSTSCGSTLMPSSFPQARTGRSSYTTVRDVGHILEDIYRGNLVSEKCSKKMLNLLKAQQRKGKIPAGLPSGVKSANKTGEYESRQHDAAIVFSKKADYIIVIFSENGGSSISNIQSLSRTTYNYFN